MTALPKILSAPAVADVPGAIARFHAIEAALPPNDGIVWFTRLYRSVTEAVDAQLGKQKFADPACLARLDVVFVNLYLDALRAWAAAPSNAPKAWLAALRRPLDPADRADPVRPRRDERSHQPRPARRDRDDLAGR